MLWKTFNRTLWNWNRDRQQTERASDHPFNRTLWNWNKRTAQKYILFLYLLIEPYGIEIKELHKSTYYFYMSFNRTLWNWNGLAELGEMNRENSFNRTLWNWNISQKSLTWGKESSFNRTLWNWNYILCQGHLIAKTSFNRTLWNWNKSNISNNGRIGAFNRTLWNWNLSSWRTHPPLSSLLIEPYGIEIFLKLD